METTICRHCGGVINGDPADNKVCLCGHRPPDSGWKKVCCRCGKDLTGHTRYHDKEGAYWCRACHLAQEHETQKLRIVCDDCHKKIPPTKVDPYDGRTLCGACARERALDKSRPHRESYNRIYDQIERRRTWHIVIACLLVVVAVFALVWLRVI